MIFGFVLLAHVFLLQSDGTNFCLDSPMESDGQPPWVQSACFFRYGVNASLQGHALGTAAVPYSMLLLFNVFFIFSGV